MVGDAKPPCFSLPSNPISKILKMAASLPWLSQICLSKTKICLGDGLCGGGGERAVVWVRSPLHVCYDNLQRNSRLCMHDLVLLQLCCLKLWNTAGATPSQGHPRPGVKTGPNLIKAAHRSLHRGVSALRTLKFLLLRLRSLFTNKFCLDFLPYF